MTPEYLHKILDYEPSTGIFKWKVKKSRSVSIGNVAGQHNHPLQYIIIVIDSKRYQAHRLAWLYVYGKWPKDQIDHINRIKTDNRICNLREATQSLNNYNRPAHRDNKLGVRGVCKVYGKYRAQIKYDGKIKTIGTFTTVEEASDAYNKELDRLTGLL